MSLTEVHEENKNYLRELELADIEASDT